MTKIDKAEFDRRAPGFFEAAGTVLLSMGPELYTFLESVGQDVRELAVEALNASAGTDNPMPAEMQLLAIYDPKRLGERIQASPSLSAMQSALASASKMVMSVDPTITERVMRGFKVSQEMRQQVENKARDFEATVERHPSSNGMFTPDEVAQRIGLKLEADEFAESKPTPDLAAELHKPGPEAWTQALKDLEAEVADGGYAAGVITSAESEGGPTDRELVEEYAAKTGVDADSVTVDTVYVTTGEDGFIRPMTDAEIDAARSAGVIS
jgi:hypothetical protein